MVECPDLVASDGDPPFEAGKSISMFYVYLLKSLKDKKLYIGKTKDLRNRLKEHLEGEVKSTKGRLPLELIYYEAFKNQSDCGKEELFLKSGIGRESLKHRISSELDGEVA